ncbi:MAG: endolytic transglycosylase MltG [Bacteroidales bacterium]|nr:endolytic transglycosylase MltG [Bacteroidales bacterium]
MNEHKLIKRILYLFLVVLILLSIKGVDIYTKAFRPNVKIPEKKFTYIFIHTGADYDHVLNSLADKKVIINLKSFKWTAERKNYKNHIHPGRYKIQHGMSNNEIINLLRSGKQEPLMLTFNNIRLIEDLASRISRQIEADSAELVNLLRDEEYISKFGFDKYSIPGMFIPNTYEFFWNTSASAFIERMNKEYLKFWNKNRLAAADKLHFTQNEVITLASIVDAETYKNDEMQRIAGVYINRLNKGIRLHADPTVIYAVGDFTIRRVLKKHLLTDSPYNTYKYSGLPPGPISIPSIVSIEAVLNFENHNYLYFCAKEDFSGYHNFAKTLAQHQQNARLYQRALNRRKILN